MSQNDDYQILKDYGVPERVVGISAINPWLPNMTSPRANMAATQLAQAVTLCKGDPCIVQSGVEIELGKAIIDVRVKNNTEILYETTKYGGLSGVPASELSLIVKDKITNKIDILTIPRYHKFHPYFGFEYILHPNLDRMLTSRFIPAGTVLATSPQVGFNGSYNYGVNLNVAQMSIPPVTEDAKLISKSACKKLAFKKFKEYNIGICARDIPVNTYGDADTYKFIPDIGEYVRPDGVLYAAREIQENDMLALSSISNNDLREVDHTYDSIIYSDGAPDGTHWISRAKVIDISVLVSPRHKQALFNGVYESLNKYITGTKDYSAQITSAYIDLEQKYKMSHNVTDSMLPIDNTVYRTLNTHMAIGNVGGKKILYYDKKLPVDTILYLKIIVESTVVPGNGAKLTNRSGSKGMCVCVPDEWMPVDENGVRADIIEDGSVTSRMNVSVSYEHKFNAFSRWIKKMCKDKLGGISEAKLYDYPALIDEVFNIILEGVKFLGNDQYEAYLNTTLEERYHIICNDVYNNEVFLKYTINNPKQSDEIFNSLIGTPYDPVSTPITYSIGNNTYKTKKAIRIAPMYMTLLSKLPDEALAVSSARLNHYGLPVGVSMVNKHGAPYKSNPTKIISTTEARLYPAYAGLIGATELKQRANCNISHTTLYHNILSAPTPTNVKCLIDRVKHPYVPDAAAKLVREILKTAGIKISYKKGV